MKHLLSSITLLLLSTVAFGQVPNTFSSGETISSSKINANFSFLANAMGSGNVSAMMMCGDYFVIDKSKSEISQFDEITNPELAFANCVTDNITLTKHNYACSKNIYYDTSGGLYCNNGSTNQWLITSTELIEQGWIMNNVHSSQYWFYKVTSD